MDTISYHLWPQITRFLLSRYSTLATELVFIWFSTNVSFETQKSLY